MTVFVQNGGSTKKFTAFGSETKKHTINTITCGGKLATITPLCKAPENCVSSKQMYLLARFTGKRY